MTQQPGSGAEPELPYGAVEGQHCPEPLLKPDAWSPVSNSPTGRQWFAGERAEFRPSPVAVVLAALLFVASGITIGVVVRRHGPQVFVILLGILLIFALLALIETLYARVWVDRDGIARRSLRGLVDYRREELDTPVLHRYVRRSRTAKQQVARLSIRKIGGQYGFMITSDLFRYVEVEQIARRVGAALPTATSGLEIESKFPGATRWVHRLGYGYQVLIGVIGGLAIVLLVLGMNPGGLT